MLAYGFDSFAVDGRLIFATAAGGGGRDRPGDLVAVGREPVVSLTRSPAAETAGRVTLGFVRADLDYSGGRRGAGAGRGRAEHGADRVPIVLSDGEAKASPSGG